MVEITPLITDHDDEFSRSLCVPRVIVGIPALNEERSIASVVLQAQKFAQAVIVCDDGSTDLTADIAERLGAFVIRHDVNRGKGCALRTIFEASTKFKPDIVVTIDADGQHDPNEIPQLIEPLVTGQSDVVLGSRYVSSSPMICRIPRYRQLGLSAINWLNRKANKSDVRDTQNGFRAFNLKALEAVSSFESNGFSVESEQIVLASNMGLKITEVPINTKYEGLEKTSKKFALTHGIGLVSYVLRVIVEDKPLVVLGIPGVMFLAIGALFGGWMLDFYSVKHYITTNIALATITFTLMGFFCVFASITLYSISRLSKKMNHRA